MREKDGEHPSGDAGQLLLFGLFLVVWVGDSFFLHLSTFPSQWVPLSVRLVLLGLSLLAAVYLARAGLAVAHEKRPDYIVSNGAFRYVRHPLYLASLLTYLGLAIATLSLVSVGLLVVILGFYSYIASYEEQLLQMRFGEEYQTYKRRTGKWLPRLRPRH